MENISPDPVSVLSELLDCCLEGRAWPVDVLECALAIDDGRAFLSVVVERLGDLFEPRLSDTYADLFSEVILRVTPHLRSRLRGEPSGVKAPASADRVYVLSRITLGADVAITSVLMDAAKQRYPEAQILFVGPRKNFELFEGDPRVSHFPAPYARGGTLRERLESSAELWFEDGIVVDPDSRLTQLGLIRVCDEDRYLFFDSRGYGNEGNDRLPKLAARWTAETFKVPTARPYIAPLPVLEPAVAITVSLGVGENAAKRISDGFERGLFRMLADTGKSVLVDLGGSPEEQSRVMTALAPYATNGRIQTHQGAFAPFAAHIARSQFFIGYDSAAGHVASACGVPLISIARGFASERMAARWRPVGNVIDGDDAGVLDQIRAILARQ